jgi:hypothetical protein
MPRSRLLSDDSHAPIGTARLIALPSIVRLPPGPLHHGAGRFMSILVARALALSLWPRGGSRELAACASSLPNDDLTTPVQVDHVFGESAVEIYPQPSEFEASRAGTFGSPLAGRDEAEQGLATVMPGYFVACSLRNRQCTGPEVWPHNGRILDACWPRNLKARS